MASHAFLLLSLALLIAAAAMALWMLVGRQQKTHRMTRHLEQSLEKSAAAAAGFTAKDAAASAFDSSVADALLGKEKKAGWPVPAILLGTVSARLFYGGLVLIAATFLAVGLAVGWLAASAALVLLGIGFFFLLYARAQKFRARLTQQLPGFLDNTVDSFEPEAGFLSLFNGRDLTGWGFRPTPPRKQPANPNPKPDAPVFVEIKEAVTFDGLAASNDNRYRAINGRLVVTTPAEGRRIQQLSMLLRKESLMGMLLPDVN
jgi:hypothetical protein